MTSKNGKKLLIGMVVSEQNRLTRFGFFCLLMFSVVSCHNPKEKYQLSKITLGLYSLHFDESIGKYYPLKYVEGDSNSYFLLTVDFDFEFIDDPAHPAANPSDGVLGPVDTILAVNFYGFTHENCDTSLPENFVIDQTTHSTALPYHENDVHISVDELVFCASTCNLDMIRRDYNFGIDTTIIPQKYLWEDQFYYIRRENMNSFLNGEVDIQLVIYTNLDTITSNKISLENYTE